MRKLRFRARRSLLALPLLALPLVAFGIPARQARAADPDASKITLAARTSRLANGLEVVLHEDHRTPIVAVEPLVPRRLQGRGRRAGTASPTCSST